MPDTASLPRGAAPERVLCLKSQAGSTEDGWRSFPHLRALPQPPDSKSRVAISISLPPPRGQGLYSRVTAFPGKKPPAARSAEAVHRDNGTAQVGTAR